MDGGLQKLYGSLQRSRIGDGTDRARAGTVYQLIQGFGQGAEGLPVSGGHAHRRDAQLCGQGLQIKLDSALFGLVHQIDADERLRAELQKLQDQIQIPLQAAGIADCDDSLRSAEAEKIPRDLLLGRMGLQRIGARRVRELPGMKSSPKSPGGPLHGFSGPVPRVLAKSREAVEDGAFSHIGISGQGGGSGRRSFHQDLPAVPVPEGDDASPYQKGSGIAGGASADA